jgi:hypothetical protein
MVSFIDLAPTLLNIAGLEVPHYMQGTPFLGPDQEPDPPYVHTFRGRMDERYDFSRGTFSESFHYIINYMPQRKYAQHLDYLWRAPSMRAWEQAFLNDQCNEVQGRFFRTKPVEELYDRKSDPWEVKNLAGDPEYEAILKELRTATLEWQLSIGDAGFIPEGLMVQLAEDRTIYDYTHSEDYPLEEIMDMALMAIEGSAENLDAVRSGLSSDHPVIRYWAAMGCLHLGKDAEALIPELQASLKDEVPEVRILAAESLYKLGRKDAALKTLGETLILEPYHTPLMALNTIQDLGPEAIEPLRENILDLQKNLEVGYIQRATSYALETIKSSQTAN